MGSDFKDLFGEDWRPHEFDGELGGEQMESGERSLRPANPLDGEFTSENENRKPRALNEKEVKVVGVYMHQEPTMPPQHFILLRDNRGRRVPIWVGQPEALAITYALDESSPERPLTHDLMKIMIEKLGVTVDRIIIDDLWKETFYAKITLIASDGEYTELDARPSDAVALALRVHAPIYMAEYVLEAMVHKE